MSRQYPNLSKHINDLMELNDMNASALSTSSDIQLYVIKKILSGDITILALRRTLKLSKVFDMQLYEFIDFISQ